jgi:hypothetical protein
MVLFSRCEAVTDITRDLLSREIDQGCGDTSAKGDHHARTLQCLVSLHG